MTGWRACCLASATALLLSGTAAQAQYRVAIPKGSGKPVAPPPTLAQARSELLGLLPQLAEFPDICPAGGRAEGDAQAVELEGITLVRRMQAYPELAPAATGTLGHWRKNYNQRAARCSGRRMKTGFTDGGDQERATNRRRTQIMKASLAFARYRVALGN